MAPYVSHHTHISKVPFYCLPAPDFQASSITQHDDDDGAGFKFLGKRGPHYHPVHPLLSPIKQQSHHLVKRQWILI